jgi:hypothetical protein
MMREKTKKPTKLRARMFVEEIEDEVEAGLTFDLVVPDDDDEEAFTGILDHEGNPIMRRTRFPIGFLHRYS